jgi:hypothetical protein
MTKSFVRSTPCYREVGDERVQRFVYQACVRTRCRALRFDASNVAPPIAIVHLDRLDMLVNATPRCKAASVEVAAAFVKGPFLRYLDAVRRARSRRTRLANADQ